jgi:hypothetical protein
MRRPAFPRTRLDGRTKLAFLVLRVYVLITVPIAIYALLRAFF